jgi:apolipoprotein N-acyltransferase
MTLVAGMLPLRNEPVGSIPVGIVQGGVPGSGTQVAANASAITQRHVAATRDLVADVTAGSLTRPDFVVWPESSTAVDPRNDPSIDAAIQGAVEALQVPLLVGQITDATDDRFVYNQGVVRLPATEHVPTLVPRRYTKRHPVPFGEYIPFRRLLAGLSPQLDQIPRDMLPGVPSRPLSIAGVTIANAICFDVAYSDVVEPQVRDGSQVVVVQTSNASFFGTFQLEQQFAISRVRAISTGRSVVVASLNGLSGVISPTGRVTHVLPVGDTSYTVATVSLRSGLTPFVRWQRLIEATPVALVAVPALGMIRRRLGRPDRRALVRVSSTMHDRR